MKRFARGRHTPGKMNGLESRYAAYLEVLKRADLILEYEFEGMKLRLADKTFYTPDFMVLAQDSVVEFHETKGFWMDDARVKIKVAAEKFPYFRFKAMKWVKGAWEIEEF